MSNLTATQAKRRGFLMARIEADTAEVKLIDETAAKVMEKLQKGAAEAAAKLAERQARLNARLGGGRVETDPEALAGGAGGAD